VERYEARGYAQADESALLSDILKVAKEGLADSLYLSEIARKKYDSQITAQKTEDIYKKAVADFRATQKYDAVLCGYYGFGNLGDEMVLKSIKKELSPRRIAIIGANGDGRIGRLGLLSAAKAIRSSNLFILGGGSLLQNSTSRRSLEYYLTLLRIARFFGKKTMLYANGLGPINGDKAVKRCRKALSCVDVASFRDSDSFEAGKSLLCEKTVSYLTCDPALCQYPNKKVQNRILFFIRGEDVTNQLESQIKNALLRFRREITPNCEIIFASMNTKKDEIAALRLSDAMPFPTKCKFFRDTDRIFEYAAASEIIVSSRLHALIVAASASIPFTALCHDPKLEAFAKECKLPPCLRPSLNDKELEAKLFEALKYSFLENKKIRSHLQKRSAELTELSKRDKYELSRLLN